MLPATSRIPISQGMKSLASRKCSARILSRSTDSMPCWPGCRGLTTVFYDGKCGLCSKEIDHYRKIAPQGVFHWQDVTQSAEELEKRGISLAESLRLLHATDAEGKLHIGVDAFILIWSQLDRWRLLGRIVALPPVRKVADLLYIAFADKRFKKLEHCQIAARKG